MLTDANVESLSEAIGPIDARMKVIDPLISMGPSTPVRVIQWSESEVGIRVPGDVFVGAMIHLRMPDRMIFGEVRYCVPVREEFQIRVRVRDTF